MNLDVVLTVDVDNDDFTTENERTELSWRCAQLVPDLGTIARRNGLLATWFVRADNQLEDVYGACDYLLSEHANWWEAMRREGDQIGWHPHVGRRRDDGRYAPERDDAEFVRALRRTWTALTAAGHRFEVARMGEARGSNAIVAALAEFGLRADASAIAGRKRDDAQRCFDWEPTPNRPYRPAAADYRRPGEPALEIVEVPMTTAPFAARGEPQAFLRYVNPAYHEAVFQAGIERCLTALAEQPPPRVLTLVVHPDEAMPRAGGHALYAFSLDAVNRNLAYLRSAARARNWTVRAQCVGDVARSLESVP